MTNNHYFMIRACSWCKNIIGTKPIDDGAMDGETTHGVCAQCREAMLSKIKAERLDLKVKES